MPRKRTTPTLEEKPDPAPPKSETTEPANPKAEATAPATEPEVKPSESISPPSPKPEVQLQPAAFAREGRQMVCTVCGTEARLDLDQQLFCPNAHNHPPLISEASKQ